MKKKSIIYYVILGVTALLITFLIGSIANVNNDVVGLAVILTLSSIMSWGFFFGRQASKKRFVMTDLGYYVPMVISALAVAFFGGSIVNLPNDVWYLAITVSVMLALIWGYILGGPRKYFLNLKRKSKETSSTKKKST